MIRICVIIFWSYLTTVMQKYVRQSQSLLLTKDNFLVFVTLLVWYELTARLVGGNKR